MIGCLKKAGRSLPLFLFLAAAGGRLIFAGAPGAGEGLSSADADRLFAGANRLCESGSAKQAIEGYGGILDAGCVSPSLLHNLGGAWLAAGEPARAILHYRRAWRMSPRDDAIRRGAAAAAREAGVVMPRRSRLDIWNENLSFEEWIALGTALYWVCACLVGIRIATKRRAGWVRAGMLLALIGLALAAIGALHWAGLMACREAVLMRSQRAMFAPRESAAVQFELREGTIVTTREVNGDWARVNAGGREGWVPASAIAWVHSNP